MSRMIQSEEANKEGSTRAHVDSQKFIPILSQLRPRPGSPFVEKRLAAVLTWLGSAGGPQQQHARKCWQLRLPDPPRLCPKLPEIHAGIESLGSHRLLVQTCPWPQLADMYLGCPGTRQVRDKQTRKCLPSCAGPKSMCRKCENSMKARSASKLATFCTLHGKFAHGTWTDSLCCFGEAPLPRQMWRTQSVHVTLTGTSWSR